MTDRSRRTVLCLLGGMAAGGLAGGEVACRPVPSGRRSDRDAPAGPRVPGGAFVVGPFSHAVGAAVPAARRAAWTSGFEKAGVGAGLYVADDQAETLLAAHPRAVFRAGDGRTFRLGNSVLWPEMFGARGDGVTNDQPALQAMLDYAAAAGIEHVRLAPRTYVSWCPRRTTPTIGLAPDGIPLVVRSTMVIEGEKGRTTLAFRSSSGVDRTRSFQVVGGEVWRGGGMYLLGNRDAGNILKIARFEMRGVRLDGGIARSGKLGTCTVANGGEGWDVSDKGFRVQDSPVGHILLEDVEITGFRGELAYGGGTGSILSMTTRRCWFHGTNANAYNMDCGQPILDVESRWGEAFQPIEGHGGPGSRFERTTWYDCTSGGTLWGGRIGAVDTRGRLLPGTTYAESAPDDPQRIPWIHLDDLRILNCGNDNTPVLLANWIKGTVRTVDSNVYLTTSQTGQLTSMDLVIHAIADRRGVDAPVGLSGPASLHQTGPGGRLNRPPTDVRVAVSMDRTPNALAQGLGFRLPVQVDGVFGRNVIVRVLRGCSSIYAKTIGPAASMPLIDDAALEVSGGDLAFQIQSLKPGTVNHVRFTGTHMMFVAENPRGSYLIAPTKDGFADRQVIVVKSGVDNLGLVIGNGQGVHLQVPRVTLGRGQSMALAFDSAASAWRAVP